MSNVKIGVVENEMVIADTICLTLRKLGYQVLPPAHNYTAAIRMIEHQKPDVLLLDINLGGQKDGIDVAAFAREHNDAPVIFLTANSDKATVDKAKTVNPNAYLVKPFNKEDLYSAIEIAISNFAAVNSPAKPQEAMLVKDGYDFEKIYFKDVTYLGSDHNYVSFHLLNGKKIMMRSTLQEMFERLPQNTFIKLNRSYIINLQHVTRVETEKVIVQQHEFAITKANRDTILQRMQSLL